MDLFLIIYLFVLGTVFGSFFNVVGLRVPKQQLFESQRSYCPHCHHTLNWYELIPIISYFIQKGKCRNCKQPISIIYPMIELLTGLLYAYSYIHFGFQLELITALVLMSLLVIILVTDISYMLIPDQILLFFLPIFLIVRTFIPLNPWWSPLLGGIIGIIIPAVIIIVSRGGMGGGDMKLFGLLGIVLGYKQIILAFLLSTMFGAIIGGILIGLKLANRKNQIAFGPFIVLGTITSYFFGTQIINWYLTTFF